MAAKEGFPPNDKTDGRNFLVPKLSNHCTNSPCTQVCPVGATFPTPDGVVLIDYNYCLGCRYCNQACSYGCRFFHPTKHTADKCTLRCHRITRWLSSWPTMPTP
jgi:tetrathionate reductase subunit B